MRGDRQRFCPACSGAASSQRPVTGYDTSLRCKPQNVCVCVGATPALLQSAWLQHPCKIFFFLQYVSECIHSSSQALSVYLLCFVDLGSRKRIPACGEGGVAGRVPVFGGNVTGSRVDPCGVLGLCLKPPCADGVGRENPQQETNKWQQSFARLFDIPKKNKQIPI